MVAKSTRLFNYMVIKIFWESIEPYSLIVWNWKKKEQKIAEKRLIVSIFNGLRVILLTKLVNIFRGMSFRLNGFEIRGKNLCFKGRIKRYSKTKKHQKQTKNQFNLQIFNRRHKNHNQSKKLLLQINKIARRKMS